MRNRCLFGIGPDCIQILPRLELGCILFHLCNNPGPVCEGWVCILDNCLTTGRMGPLSTSPCSAYSVHHRAFFKGVELWERENVTFFTVVNTLWLKDHLGSNFGFIQPIINFLPLSLDAMCGRHHFAHSRCLCDMAHTHSMAGISQVRIEQNRVPKAKPRVWGLWVGLGLVFFFLLGISPCGSFLLLSHS